MGRLHRGDHRVPPARDRRPTSRGITRGFGRRRTRRCRPASDCDQPVCAGSRACDEYAGASDDWSITLAAGGCACEQCARLREFLAARDRRTFEWPLAEARRQHIHGRIDTAELPVSHVTRRQGRSYTLVLHKTDELFAAAANARSRDQADLEWLQTTWKAARDAD